MIQKKKLRISLTGATGLVGRNVLQCLNDQGFNSIKILSRTPKSHLTDAPHQIITGDLNDDRALEKLVEEAEVVIHCAAELKDESLMQEVNVEAAVKLARLSAAAGVKHFCHISSAGVIGPSQAIQIDETSECNPSNLYERTKWVAEQELQAVASTTNLKIWILRPTNVVDKDNHGVLTPLLKSGFLSRLQLFIKGAEHGHVVHAVDVASAAIYLVTAGNAQPGVYFVSYDEDQRNNFSDLLAIANRQLYKSSLLETFYIPPLMCWFIRRLIRGYSLHPRAIFSSEKLLSTGFKFNMGIDQIVKSITSKSSKEI